MRGRVTCAKFMRAEKTAASQDAVGRAQATPCKAQQASSKQAESSSPDTMWGQPKGDTGPVWGELANSRHFLPTAFPALATGMKDQLP